MDGCYPFGAVIRDKAGNVYGTTVNCGSSNFGTVFKLNTKNTETVLHNFAGGASDGADPKYTRLLMDKNGNFYGVTARGGASKDGVVYKLTSNGTLTVLHSFKGGTRDGCLPAGTLINDARGKLYGTTNGCGASGYGTVYKLNRTGIETVLHNFASGPSDGAYPFAGVILDKKGNLYGDTVEGGIASLYGTVYKLSKSGAR
jgi:uncharacterized repeat protein (TIGR03803 family)